MTDEHVIRTLERLILRSGTIAVRAFAEVHPEVRALSLSQYRILVLVAGAPDGLRVGEIARRTSTRQAATGRMVRRLEGQGLVWTERGGQADRRAAVIRFTELGSRTWSEISERQRHLLAAALEGVLLPPDTSAVLEAITTAFERYTA